MKAAVPEEVIYTKGKGTVHGELKTPEVFEHVMNPYHVCLLHHRTDIRYIIGSEIRLLRPNILLVVDMIRLRLAALEILIRQPPRYTDGNKLTLPVRCQYIHLINLSSPSSFDLAGEMGICPVRTESTLPEPQITGERSDICITSGDPYRDTAFTKHFTGIIPYYYVIRLLTKEKYAITQSDRSISDYILYFYTAIYSFPGASVELSILECERFVWEV